MGALVGFAPWIVFWVVGGFYGFEVAAAAAFVASVAVILPDVLHHRVKVLDAGTLVSFAALALLGLTAESAWFARYAAPLSNAALTLVILVSILVRQPFVLQYAREGRPREQWNEPHFVRACYIITWVWLTAILVQTLFTLLAVLVPAERDLFRYVIPYGALVVALAFTRWYPHHLEAAARAATNAS
jgi:intracellular septation protein A